MKQILIVIPIALAVGSTAWANACISEALSVYEMSGFSCTVGDLTFSSFGYTSASSGGAVAPPASGVTVTPVTSGFGSEFGLDFTAAWLALTGQTVDSSISFDVSSSNPEGITDLELFAVGGAGGQGGASVAEVSGLPPVSLFTAFGSGTTIPKDTTTFPPGDVFSLSLIKDIALSGGVTAGGAHISDAYNLFSETTTTMTPEPSLFLLCAGVLGFVPLARRKFLR